MTENKDFVFSGWAFSRKTNINNNAAIRHPIYKMSS
jgi:hypothetical protein